MNFKCQKDAMDALTSLATYDRHSIMIEGVQGCGKTFLARQYANLLGISDFVVIKPTVDEIRETVNAFYQLKNKSVICVENLDTGVSGAAFALLKFLEEPVSNAYVIITCRNIRSVPDTILSRSAVVSVNPPISSDLELYAKEKDPTQFVIKCETEVWSLVKSFTDVDKVLAMTIDEVDYFNSLKNRIPFRDSVSQLMWDLGHYTNNSEAPVEFVLRSFLASGSHTIRRAAIECLDDLSSNRIAQHAILAKFIFEVKYSD